MAKRKEARIKRNDRVFDTDTKTMGTVRLVEVAKDKRGEEYHRATVQLDSGETVSQSEFRFEEVIDGQIRLSQVEPFIASTSYSVDIDLGYLEEWLTQMAEGGGLDLNPDFQRGHVWIQEQQERFIEYRLRGGIYGKDVWFNCATWMKQTRTTEPEQPVIIVDGLQRLTALRGFMANEIPAFGQKYNEFHPEDQRNIRLNHNAGLRFHINDLRSHKLVLKWYLDLNAGGRPHAPSEIERVGNLLEEENVKETKK